MRMVHDDPPMTHDRMVRMFSGIAGRYDLMNTLMTFGLDRKWRRCLVRQACLKPGQQILDVGAGTGAVAAEVRTRMPWVRVVAGDMTLAMMAVGRNRPGADGVLWTGADALSLPFRDKSFDAVVSAYLIRNLEDLDQGLQEQYRVLKSGGRLVCLDSCPPPTGPLRPFILFYMKVFIPVLGKWVTGKGWAYQYLPGSIERFKSPAQLAGRLRKAGLVEVGYRTFLFGTMCVLRGIRE